MEAARVKCPLLGLLVTLGACAKTPAPAVFAAAPAPVVAPPSRPAPTSPPVAVLAPAAPAAPVLPCEDSLESTQARLSCDGTRLLVRGPLELHPNAAAPTGESKRALDGIGALMRRRTDVLLVRIEVRPNHPGRDPEAERALIGEAQRRADAIFAYLWHKQGISAERLEAVGYSFDPEAADGSRWPVRLRVVQRDTSAAGAK